MIHLSMETSAHPTAHSTDVSAETLKTDVTAETSKFKPETETSHIEDGPHVSAETSRRLCCDTSISKLVEDEKGRTALNRAQIQGHSARHAAGISTRFNHGLKINLHLSFHDLVDRGQIGADGGETSLDNLVLRCRMHHRLVHEGGFGCERDSDGNVMFTNQIGKPIAEYGREPPTDLENFVKKLKEKLEDRHIDSQTCVTQWAGEKMDKHVAVELLWYRDHSLH